MSSTDLSKWTKTDLIRALERCGYSDDGIIESKFAGVNDRNQAMFDITFNDIINGGVDRGRVFVFIHRNGQLIADYQVNA